MTEDRLRTRLTAVLFAGNALSSTSYILAVTVSSLAAANLTGNPRLAGIPSAGGTVGAAIGASALAAVSTRLGRRRPFILWFLVAALGAAVGAAGIQTKGFILLVVAMFVVGFGRSVNQMARFAAADMQPAAKRGTAIALIVWASTVGSVVGPLLLEPSSATAQALGFTSLAGAYAFSTVGFAGASLLLFLFLRPDPLTLSVADEVLAAGPVVDIVTTSTPLRQLLGRPTVKLALATMLTSQLVMVLVMTMTPIHIKDLGGTLGMIGWVMMAHTLGMFALSPVTGRLVDRIGPRRMIWAGMIVLLVACAIAITADRAEQTILLGSLFLLGLGWNFGYVAGSAELQVGLTLGERVRMQGFADSATWIAGGVGAVASGFILGLWSYPVLATIGLLLALIPLWFLVRTRPAAIA